jgi:nitrate reductase cytochrome c-type subunit
MGPDDMFSDEQVTVENAANIPDDPDITYLEEAQKEEEARKQRERIMLEKQNEFQKRFLKQKKFQTKPPIIRHRINMGKR